MKSRDLELKVETKDKGEELTAKGRTPNRNWNQGQNWNKNKVRGRKCYYYHKEGCFEKQSKDKDRTQTNGDLAIVSNDLDIGEVLVVSLKF